MYILVLICTDNKLKMYDAPFIHKFKTHYNGTLGTIEGFFLTVFVLRGTDLQFLIKSSLIDSIRY